MTHIVSPHNTAVRGVVVTALYQRDEMNRVMNLARKEASSLASKEASNYYRNTHTYKRTYSTYVQSDLAVGWLWWVLWWWWLL